MVGHTLRLTLAYILKNRHLFIFGLVFGVFTALFVVNFGSKLLKSNNSKTIGLAGNFTVANLPLVIQEEISLGLTKILPDGSATDAAALSFTATNSGKTYLFNLKDNLFWQDGKRFTSSDVNYNLADVKITPLDDKNVRFDLAGSFSPMPAIVSQPLFRPGLIGLGAYKVKSLKSAGRFLHNISLIKNGETILYKFYPTEPALITAFKLGEVDSIITENLTGLNNYHKEEKINYNKQAIAFFNTKTGVTSEKNFRQGLLYGLSEFSGFGEPSFGPIAPTSWAYNQSLKKYKTKKSDATQSGELKLTTTLALCSVGEELKKMWEQLGLKINLETSDIIPENFEVYLTYVEIPADPDQYQLWHSTSLLNISQYKSPKSDKLLEEGRQNTDVKIRKQIYFDWQKAITEDAPAAFLFFPKIYTVSRN